MMLLTLPKLGIFFGLIAVVISKSVDNGRVRYDNFKLYNVVIELDYQYEVLTEELTKFPEYFNIWSSSRAPNGHMNIMVSSELDEQFQQMLEFYAMKYNIEIDNIQRFIDQQQPKDLDETTEYDWRSYYKLPVINNWLDEIAENYTEIVEKFSIGKSYEGREIYGLKISHNKPGNKAIFIECHIHAREWITSATATYVINELLKSTDPDVKNMAETIDWYIIPVLNVDGFVYTYDKDRMWRKTRQPHPDQKEKCIGVDGNRNFDSHWMENNGASSNPCDETYGGPEAFSEPETKALADFYKTIKENVKIYLSFHSYGQLLLSPFGHNSNDFPENYNDMQEVAKATVNAIKTKYSTNYRYGSTASILYVASGVSPDWAYNTQGTKLAYTFEFRDQGKFGFLLPFWEIIPNAKETMDGLKAMVSKAKELQYL